LILEIAVAVETTLLLAGAVLLRAYARANTKLATEGTLRVQEERQRAERRIDEERDRARELLQDVAEREERLITRVTTEPKLRIEPGADPILPLQDRVSISDFDDATWDALHQPKNETVEVAE
jgi:hypothetical protein